MMNVLTLCIFSEEKNTHLKWSPERVFFIRDKFPDIWDYLEKAQRSWMVLQKYGVRPRRRGRWLYEEGPMKPQVLWRIMAWPLASGFQT